MIPLRKDSAVCVGSILSNGRKDCCIGTEPPKQGNIVCEFLLIAGEGVCVDAACKQYGSDHLLFGGYLNCLTTGTNCCGVSCKLW